MLIPACGLLVKRVSKLRGCLHGGVGRSQDGREEELVLPGLLLCCPEPPWLRWACPGRGWARCPPGPPWPTCRRSRGAWRRGGCGPRASPGGGRWGTPPGRGGTGAGGWEGRRWRGAAASPGETFWHGQASPRAKSCPQNPEYSEGMFERPDSRCICQDATCAGQVFKAAVPGSFKLAN